MRELELFVLFSSQTHGSHGFNTRGVESRRFVADDEQTLVIPV